MERAKLLISPAGILALLMASGAIGYFLAGFDLIPDSIPVVGYLDDVLMALLLVFVGHHLLAKYVFKQKK